MKLITGAAGFIGSNLVAAFEEAGKEVAICDWLDNPVKKYNLGKRSISHEIHPENLFDFMGDYADKIDTIILLGAITSTTETNISLLTKVNVELPMKIWAWCRDNGVKLIYASSAATYGNGSRGFNDNITIEELLELRPLNAYGNSKNQFDIWVAKQIRDGLGSPPQWVGLKFFNVFGPNEYHKGGQMSVVPQFYKQILNSDRARLFKSYNREYEDGEQLRDFIWVGDCINIIQWFDKDSRVSGLFNCGTGQARTFLDIAKAIFTVMGKEFAVDFVPIPTNIRDKYQYFTQANIKKLRRSGYSGNFTPLEEGVRTYLTEFLMS